MYYHKGLLKNLDITEVRVSDRYNLVLAATKTQLVKGNTKTKTYWNYSLSYVDSLKKDMDCAFKKYSILNVPIFEYYSFKFFTSTHLPNKNVLRLNDNPFMVKALQEAIMHR